MKKIHLQDLAKVPKRTWVKLEDEFRKKLFRNICNKYNTNLYQLAIKINKKFRKTSYTFEVYNWYKGERFNSKCTSKRPHGIPLNILLYLVKLVGVKMEKVEKHIEFIKGDIRGGKVFKPKFPILLNKATAATIAHILHDGYLSEKKLRVVYGNKDQDNLKHFKKNIIEMFGASRVEFGEIKSKGGIRIDAPNIIGYVLTLFGLQPGNKLKINCRVPKAILNCKNLETITEFIESTIADDGCVVRQTHQAGGCIKIFSSSFQNRPPQLLLDDMNIFKKLGIKTTKPRMSRRTVTKNGELRYAWEFSVGGQRNLVLLYSFIKIPTKRKQKKFDSVIGSYKKLEDAVLLNNKLSDRTICKSAYLINP